MSQKRSQDQLLDEYIDALMNDPRALPPLELDAELAHFARTLLLTRQLDHPQDEGALDALQERVWSQILFTLHLNPGDAALSSPINVIDNAAPQQHENAGTAASSAFSTSSTSTEKVSLYGRPVGAHTTVPVLPDNSDSASRMTAPFPQVSQVSRTYRRHNALMLAAMLVVMLVFSGLLIGRAVIPDAPDAYALSLVTPIPRNVSFDTGEAHHYQMMSHYQVISMMQLPVDAGIGQRGTSDYLLIAE